MSVSKRLDPINFSMLFESIHVPTPSDPTGGLLQPILAPVDFIVTQMEESVLSLINESLVLFNMALGELSDGLNDDVDRFIGEAFKKIKDVVKDGGVYVTNAINGITGATDSAINAIFGIVDDIEKVMIQGMAAITSYVSSALNFIKNGATNIKNKIADIENYARTTIVQEINSFAKNSIQRINSISATISDDTDQAIQQVQNTVDNMVKGTASKLNSTLSNGSSAATSIVKGIESVAKDSVNLLDAARTKGLAEMHNASNIGLTVQRDISATFKDVTTEASSLEKDLGSLLKLVTAMNTILFIGTVLGMCYVFFRYFR